MTAADFAGWRRTGRVVAVHDGDTCTLALACWPGLVETVAVRIAGIDAPELRGNPHGPADPGPAAAARDFLRELLGDGVVHVAPRLDRRGNPIHSFERVVADLYRDAPGAPPGRPLLSVAAALVAAGHARPVTHG